MQATVDGIRDLAERDHAVERAAERTAGDSDKAGGFPKFN